MSSPEIVSTGKSSDKETFSFSKEQDGIKKTVRGEEVENGWIVTVDKEWEEKSVNGTSEWKFNSWKYISPVDPRELAKEKEDVQKPVINTEDAVSWLKSVSDSQGLLIVT